MTEFGPQPADKVDELTQQRAQLVAALGDNGAADAPEAAALAQTYYACWVEQQHENFQPHDIAYCRDGFYKNMAILNDAVVPGVAGDCSRCRRMCCSTSTSTSSARTRSLGCVRSRR